MNWWKLGRHIVNAEPLDGFCLGEVEPIPKRVCPICGKPLSEREYVALVSEDGEPETHKETDLGL